MHEIYPALFCSLRKSFLSCSISIMQVFISIVALLLCFQLGVLHLPVLSDSQWTLDPSMFIRIYQSPICSVLFNNTGAVGCNAAVINDSIDSATSSSASNPSHKGLLIDVYFALFPSISIFVLSRYNVLSFDLFFVLYQHHHHCFDRYFFYNFIMLYMVMVIIIIICRRIER